MRARLLVVTCTAFALQFAISTPLGALQHRSTAEAPPQLIGTWRLNVAKSKYSPGPAASIGNARLFPSGRRRQRRRLSRARRWTAREVRVHGELRQGHHGHRHPEYDSVTLRKVDDLTSDAVLSHAGTVYGVARRTIAADGKTMTITFDRKSSETPVHNVAVYDKVAN